MVWSQMWNFRYYTLRSCSYAGGHSRLIMKHRRLYNTIYCVIVYTIILYTIIVYSIMVYTIMVYTIIVYAIMVYTIMVYTMFHWMPCYLTTKTNNGNCHRNSSWLLWVEMLGWRSQHTTGCRSYGGWSKP